MNEKKIKELEVQIKALKEEKPKTDREILESIEKILKELVSKHNDPFFGTTLNPPSKQPINTFYPFMVYPEEAPYRPTFSANAGSPDLERDPDFHKRQYNFRKFLMT